MRIKANLAAVFLPILFFTVILFTTISGTWKTESSKIPVRFETGENAGAYNPADIRGSYSLQDIENAFEIPVEILAKAFGFRDEENPSAIQVKELEERYGVMDNLEVGTDSVRWFTALFLGLPFDPGEDTGLPQPALNQLRSVAGLDPAVLEILQDRVVNLEQLELSSGTDNETDDYIDIESRQIKGSTLFGDLLDWGLSEEAIEEVLGGPMGERTQFVRDYCINKGIEFSTVKTRFQLLLDSL